jgi:hypothetical protein
VLGLEIVLRGSINTSLTIIVDPITDFYLILVFLLILLNLSYLYVSSLTLKSLKVSWQA